MKYKSILVTGGAGFIGSAFIHYVFKNQHDRGHVINLDALTYAGNRNNLAEIESQYADRYTFVHGDIRNRETVHSVFEKYDIDAVVHFAAESHVDRSIVKPGDFISTNITGTFVLLEEAKAFWAERSDVRFHHVSTDEVFGTLGKNGYFTEKTPYDPRSPYAASKASSDHLVRSYFHTYGLPITISNCSNNYGPRQFPEKLIPMVIESALEDRSIPVYGDGLNVRDWLHVDDHAHAVWSIFTKAAPGKTYVVGGSSELSNIDLVKLICRILAEETGCSLEKYEALITFVKDRPGHDRRYAMDTRKINDELQWGATRTLDEGLRETIQWYLENRTLVKQMKSDSYRSWMQKNYSDR